MQPTLIVHGGAGAAASPARAAELAAALRDLCRRRHEALVAGGHALDAVVNAVRELEDDPRFNAGTGSKLQLDGQARLSASVMCAERGRFAGVVNVQGLTNPVLLARLLLDDDDRVLAGEGALRRARELGLPEGDPRTAERVAAWRERVQGVLGADPHDGGEGRTGTVGAVAVDLHGQLAAATSTGGRGFEQPGRVSDTPTIAANLATARCAISLTGVGEHIVDGWMGPRLVAGVEAGATVMDAGAALVAEMQRRKHEAGFIALSADGRWTYGHSTPGMHWWGVGGGRDEGSG